ncbi:MAG: amidohydrolase family protein, partial [candidate division Zixibacteria bacterium]|nr:amidohydrolase family protein [candidate division Zixibacteria bacterium]
TVANGIRENTDLLFDKGMITQIAANITPPPDAIVVDVTGKKVYPGLIALGTTLGLTEIGAVRATNDISETGRINPDVQSHMAYNPDSEIIPTVRSNGIAYAQIVPGGPLINGRSCLLNLDAWTKEDAAVEMNLGLHVVWPNTGVSVGRRDRRSAEEQREANARDLADLYKAFDDALAYKLAKEANPNTPVDSRWEAMVPVLSGKLPLFVHANDYRQIEQAIEFAKKRNLRMILMGGNDAGKAADLLVANNIPVVYFATMGLPAHQDDPYDQAYTVPRLLYNAGVKLCLAVGGATGVRNLPFEAGHTVGFGLPADAALRSITLTPAEVLGVADRLGSLEVGKRATIVVSEGDIMDHLTHNVTHLFIDGRAVDLDNKQKELYRKYSAKHSE